MAEDKTVEEFDDDGNPITKDPDEDGDSQPSKIKSEEDTEKEPDEKPSGEDDEPEVPVRRSSLQHILNRKNKTIEKLRSKKDDDEEDDTPLDEDFDDDSKNTIAREVKKAITPVMDTLISQSDENELKELFEVEPDAKALSKQIRAYMRHPSYKGVPPSVIYHHLAFDKALGGSIKKKSTADIEAKHQKGAGSTRRSKESTGDIPDVTDMDEKDFEDLQQQARTGKFVK